MPDVAAVATRIALIGAESTGKTTLAAALVPQLVALTGLRVAWVPELLRAWCDSAGRTPRQDEQAGILHAQHARIEAAAAQHDVVVCDTTALMTAVYSRIIFGDRSLDEAAAQLHAGLSMTLLTAIDIPWVADGLQRDGPHVQEPVDDALRELLHRYALPYSVVHGSGETRLAHAVAAVMPALRGKLAAGNGRHSGVLNSGLFTRLAAADDADSRSLARYCECCSVPAYERALLKRAIY